ncbi:lipocalin family protein [Mucilaginibacter endophyticus]|uniref:lipocalin family protein n=1 Tax=Mucilaginibacter endophyticus TaxID=2675003 RepID=UPI000E0D8044|nr:lipocalin family protein [Mucilaginibacter endophyticus]
MKKAPLLFFLLLISIALIVNSCKKDNLSHIPGLMAGKWQLASITVTNYVGDSQVSLDTLNQTCSIIQYFTFKADNSCNYTNFQCNADSAVGRWGLTANKLFLTSDMVCKDTTKSSGGTSKPFANAKIVTLGNYSLVLETGDVEPNYSATKKRRVMRYGFIRQRTTASQ